MPRTNCEERYTWNHAIDILIVKNEDWILEIFVDINLGLKKWNNESQSYKIRCVKDKVFIEVKEW